jgi:S1-C subfamily serine protease
MKVLDRLAIVRTLYARGLLVPILAIVVVVGVLLHGALTRTPPPEEPDVVADMGPPTLPAPTAPFRPQLEKTPLTYEADYWRQLSERAADKLVLVGGTNRLPAVVIAPGFALTSIRAAEGMAAQKQRPATDETSAGSTPSPAPASAGGPVVEAGQSPAGSPRLVGVDVPRGLALFAIEGQQVDAFSAIDTGALRAGEYVAAITLGAGGELCITPGHLSSASSGGLPFERLEVAIPFSSPPPAAAIVDLDGRLVGLAIEDGDRIRMLTARAALEAVARLRDGGACRAIEVVAVDETVRSMFRVPAAVLVEFVLPDAFRSEPPIRPGDVLLEWNGHPVGSPAVFAELYGGTAPSQAVTFRVLRERRIVTGELHMPLADCRPAPLPVERFAALGFDAQWVEPGGAGAAGWEVDATSDKGPAAGGGLEPSDLIVAVDGRRVTADSGRAAFERFAGRSKPLLLTVERDGRMKMVVIEPRDE